MNEHSAPTAVERKLRAAMERLLAGTAERTDGRLIKENLYREAEVSRATMNRATAVIAEWSRRVDGTQPRDRELEQLRERLAEASAEARRWRTKVSDLETELTITATAIAELHAENQLLRDEDPTRNISPLRRQPNSHQR